MINKYFAILLIALMSISNSFASNFFSTRFTEIARSFNTLFTTDVVVFFFMFVAFFFGVFSLIKTLLKSAFKSHALGSEKKATNVIAFMISFIGTSGIAFMFNNNPKQFVLFFGGIFGFLIIIVFAFLIMQLFINMANSVAPKEGDTRKNKGAYWTLIIVGSLLVAYLILGFTGKVLIEMGCTTVFSQHASGDKIVCNYSALFTALFSFASTVISWIWNLIIIGIVFGSLWWFLFRDPKASSDKNLSDDEKKAKKEKTSNIKKVEGALNSISKAGKRLSEASKKEQELIKQMSQYLDQLDSTNSSRVPGEKIKGGNK